MHIWLMCILNFCIPSLLISSYRIVAVDNDLVSFVDVRKLSPNDSSKEWPIILITNPKNVNFLLPKKEPFHRIEFSTHIR